ncbi:hypothetical protein DFP76_101306 [Marinomonas aquiplantarum]|uniref:Uncharacterized protein n=1 Tax=Marinomonas aquiplantarum TaxID=491951 RepID=A0A366D7L7_9GAMM|nr:hypothetical protein DFP76_101306 [Marinomonas aquiplantarum]
MAILVFRLKYVPEEEIDDIRQLLTEHDIDFYETSAGRWQISMAGIWVRDKQQAEQARALIREDQLERSRDMKIPTAADYLLGYFQHARQNPAEAFFTLVAIGLILSLSILPFILS